MPGGYKEWRAGQRAAASEDLQYSRHTPEGARDYKLLKKEIQQISLTRNLHVRGQRTYIHKKRLERPPESLAELIGEDIFLYEVSL